VGTVLQNNLLCLWANMNEKVDGKNDGKIND
jgi:hypothetical protein